MKKFTTAFMALAFVLSCNNKEEALVQSATTAEEKVDYAYTIKEPDNWLPGSKQNTKMVLQALKDYETNNIESCMNAFADTVEIRYDYFEGRLPKDSAKQLIAGIRNSYQKYEVIMNDWESVKSKDGKTEYVSLWYKEKFTTADGITDSISVMEDLKIGNGKIIEMDLKFRHFPKK